MDAIKIKNISEKLVLVNFAVDILNGGNSVTVTFSSAGPEYSILLDVSSESTSTYKLGETFSRALQDYAKDLERDLLAATRSRT